MLQMLNVDQKKDGEDMIDEDNNLNGKKLILPNLPNKQYSAHKDPMNISMDFNSYDEINGNGNLNNMKDALETQHSKDPYRPKM
jgi:hypothetical protein